MERKISMTDFDPILKDYFEEKYGVGIDYEQTPDGDFSLSISGDQTDEVAEELLDLSSFQALLETPEMKDHMQGLIDDFSREINNPGGKLN